jgi:hypothetical protein
MSSPKNFAPREKVSSLPEDGKIRKMGMVKIRQQNDGGLVTAAGWLVLK